MTCGRFRARAPRLETDRNAIAQPECFQYVVARWPRTSAFFGDVPLFVTAVTAKLNDVLLIERTTHTANDGPVSGQADLIANLSNQLTTQGITTPSSKGKST
ncbi:hypothetical protein FUT69_00080 [Xylella taiwanensis]|uniref:Uncharacterized protein n=1 Tax=Xylella taiwanensis TaxID=1444770 RepID=Z9JH83_9GAMM|nr:hypothetical protein [Xylella taiwanensis]AXI83234.1 hypothetical protein AB672_04430 [Xylella taiwanensis]EWS77092.1 hypothetical protein AF72_12655 [Xylella taiwanensis]MCD8456292.1 hypothetical protein [Xylella taiwanensis]MCD8458700.1 hypothetical protein [Xylella taiwanensis]MCD8460836.1 hypothetical protein [Xylella taiwanensis]